MKKLIVLAIALAFGFCFSFQAMAQTPTKEKGKQAGEADQGTEVKDSTKAKAPKGSKRAGDATTTLKTKKSKKSAPITPSESLTPTKEKGKAAGEASTTAAPK
ncbi:MAG: hypothetical protein LLG06_07160 [Desulfobacteraceae bacterium]|nr:hypothetical protein [Desulfobacteraceae bacterium]